MSTPTVPGAEVVRIGSAPGVVLDVLDLGATAHRLEVTGGDGVRRNVLLGYASATEYLAGGTYLGAIVGRYANRIAAGRFDLLGTPVRVGVHDRGQSLHGGPDGFDRRRWTLHDVTGSSVSLRLLSPDGDQGFPGNLEVQASYRVEGRTVRIELEARTDAATVVNLSSHAYFNLDGDGSGTVDDHRLTVPASAYTPIDEDAIPVGYGADVTGTPFDFRAGPTLGAAARSNHPQAVSARGIDHNLELDGWTGGGGRRLVALLDSPHSRTRLAISADQPGLQVYTGNNLDGTTRSRDGVAYRQGDGIALEPQLFPDTPNRADPHAAVLRPGEVYRSTIEWTFSSLA